MEIPQTMLDALQTQLDDHFRPAWGKTAALRLVTDPADTDPTQIVCTVYDYTDISGLLGYHFCQNNGTPYARIFARTAESAGQALSTVLSHELLELLANPTVNAFLLDDSGRGTGCIYNLEVCDPVEHQVYEINGFPVSDFVTPRFYLNSASGPYNFLDTIPAPFTPAPGGRVPMKLISGLPSVFG